MDRGAWQASVHEVKRDGHNLATKPHQTKMLLHSKGNHQHQEKTASNRRRYLQIKYQIRH